MSTRLVPITLENVRAVAALEPAPHQRGLVAPNALTLAEAALYGEIAVCRAVEHDGALVGFVALAVELAQSLRPDAEELRLSHVVQAHDPGPFYERLGFVYTGEVDDDGERVMRLPLSPR